MDVPLALIYLYENILSNVLWSIQTSIKKHYNTLISQFVCDPTLYLTSPDMAGYTLKIPRWCVATAGEVYSSQAPTHTFFARIRVVLDVAFIPFVICSRTNDFRLTNDGRLFSSLYF